MAVNNDDSVRVSVAVLAASAEPANIKTVTKTATPVLTRLATSAEHESTSGGRNLAEPAANVG
jgi:hypothetical protein